MTIAVRQATTADAAVVSALNAEVQALHAAALPWRFKPQGPDTFPPATARALLAQPENLIFVAEVDQAPVGYAYAEVISRPETAMTYAYAVVYLHHLGVQAAHRRQGIGGALVERVHAVAKQREIERVGADVWSFNDDARAFFRRLGFATYNEKMWLG